MKPCSQTKDWCVCLGGYTLPKYALYGNVSGVTYWASPKTWEYVVHILIKRKNGKPAWTSGLMAEYPQIRNFIKKFVKSADFRNFPVEFCAHKTAQAEDFRRGQERHEARKERRSRELDRVLLADAPRDRRIPDPMYKSTAYQVDSPYGRIDGMSTAPAPEKQTVNHMAVKFEKIARTDKWDKPTIKTETVKVNVAKKTGYVVPCYVDREYRIRIERDGSRRVLGLSTYSLHEEENDPEY